ncbi:unnamed protein product, partial [Didymodactylos carnosus]
MQRNVSRQTVVNSLASSTTATTDNTHRKRTRSTNLSESDGQSLSSTSNTAAVTKRQRNTAVSAVSSPISNRPISHYRFRNRSQTITRSSTPDPRQRLISRRQNQNVGINNSTTSSSRTITTTRALREADNHVQQQNSGLILPPINDTNRTRYDFRPRTQQQTQASPIRRPPIVPRDRPLTAARTTLARNREENLSMSSPAPVLQRLPLNFTDEPMAIVLDTDSSWNASSREPVRNRTTTATTTVPLALPTTPRPATRQYRFIYVNDSDDDETLPSTSADSTSNPPVVVSHDDESSTTTTRSQMTSSTTNATTRRRSSGATSSTNESSNQDSGMSRVRLSRAIEIVIDSIQSLEGAVNSFDQLVFGLIYSRMGSNNFDGIEGMIRLSRILNLPTRLTQTEIDSLPKIVFANKIPTLLRNDNEKEKCP